MSSSDVQGVRDLMYAIEATLDDVDADLAAGEEASAMLDHLYRACAEVRRLAFEPLAIGAD